MSTGAGKLRHPYYGLFVLDDGWGWLTFELQYTAALESLGLATNCLL
jgi:hypothetical protein